MTHWTKLLRLVPDSRPEVKTSLSQFLNDARDRAGMETLIVADRVESNQREITVNVALDDSLHTQISANETLFIYAKAATGPPMPLSLVRLSAGDLPVTVRLTKELAKVGKSRDKVEASLSKKITEYKAKGALQSKLADVEISKMNKKLASL
mgnify:CR=1 FL=1